MPFVLDLSALGGDADLDLFLPVFPALAGRLPLSWDAIDFEPFDEEDEPESEPDPDDDESESESEFDSESESLLLLWAAISLSYARFFSRNMSFGALLRKARRSSVKAPSPIEVK